MSFVIFRCYFSEACRPWPMLCAIVLTLMLSCIFSYATAHAWRYFLMLHVVGNRCLLIVHGLSQMLPYVGRWKSFLTDAHSMIDACRHWLMLDSIGRRCLWDEHTPCKMHASLGWYSMSLADIACLKKISLWLCFLPLCACQRWSRKATSKVVWPLCAGRSQYKKDMLDVSWPSCKPKVMVQPVSGRCRLANAQATIDVPSWCTNSTTHSCRSWIFLLAIWKCRLPDVRQ